MTSCHLTGAPVWCENERERDVGGIFPASQVRSLLYVLELRDCTGARPEQCVRPVAVGSDATVDNVGFVWEGLFGSVRVGHFSMILLCVRSSSGSGGGCI